MTNLKINAPDKILLVETFRNSDESQTMIVTYADGTVIKSTLHESGSVDVDINKECIIKDGVLEILKH